MSEGIPPALYCGFQSPIKHTSNVSYEVNARQGTPLATSASNLKFPGGFFKMRNISRLLLVFAVLALTTYTFAGQITTPPPAQTAQQEKTFEGTLMKVDSDAKTLTVKDADNKEMVFHYTEQTQIVGSEKNVQGLAAKSGSKLNVSYRVERGGNNATRIEVQ
jgi:hypothetical protein